MYSFSPNKKAVHNQINTISSDAAANYKALHAQLRERIPKFDTPYDQRKEENYIYHLSPDVYDNITVLIQFIINNTRHPESALAHFEFLKNLKQGDYFEKIRRMLDNIAVFEKCSHWGTSHDYIQWIFSEEKIDLQKVNRALDNFIKDYDNYKKLVPDLEIIYHLAYFYLNEEGSNFFIKTINLLSQQTSLSFALINCLLQFNFGEDFFIFILNNPDLAKQVDAFIQKINVDSIKIFPVCIQQLHQENIRKRKERNDAEYSELFQRPVVLLPEKIQQHFVSSSRSSGSGSNDINAEIKACFDPYELSQSIQATKNIYKSRRNKVFGNLVNNLFYGTLLTSTSAMIYGRFIGFPQKKSKTNIAFKSIFTGITLGSIHFGYSYFAYREMKQLRHDINTTRALKKALQEQTLFIRIRRRPSPNLTLTETIQARFNQIANGELPSLSVGGFTGLFINASYEIDVLRDAERFVLGNKNKINDEIKAESTTYAAIGSFVGGMVSILVGRDQPDSSQNEHKRSSRQTDQADEEEKTSRAAQGLQGAFIGGLAGYALSSATPVQKLILQESEFILTELDTRIKELAEDELQPGAYTF